jgi:hypothetical protein
MDSTSVAVSPAQPQNTSASATTATPISPPRKIMRRSGVRRMISPPRAFSAG